MKYMADQDLTRKRIMMSLKKYQLKEPGKVYVRESSSWAESIPPLLDAAGMIDTINITGKNRVLIKPNLVEVLDPPITTPVELVAEVVAYLTSHLPNLIVLVGEGSGAIHYDTFHSFESLGYTSMAREMDIELVDLNEESLVCLKNKGCRRWPEMYLPEIVFDSFLLSIPVLKAHSLAEVTLTMKNMMGIAPPSHYQKGGHWKKAAFHNRIQEAVFDLNRYRTPDFTLLDATVGMQEAHLWGPTCDPPPNKLAAGHDPVAIDAYGALLLGRNWRDVGHLHAAHGELGLAEPLDIVFV